MIRDNRKFVAKKVREDDNKVCYEMWIDHVLLCIVWISAEHRVIHGIKSLEEWCRRHEENLKDAGIVRVDLSREILKLGITEEVR